METGRPRRGAGGGGAGFFPQEQEDGLLSLGTRFLSPAQPLTHLLARPKAQPLCTGAESNLRDRVLGEVEKNSFIALPGKGGPSRLAPLRIVCFHLGGFNEELYSNSARVGWLTRLGCVQVRYSFHLSSGGQSRHLDELLWSLESCLRWFLGFSSLD